MEDITLAVVVIASVVALTQLWRYLYGQQLHLPGPSRLQALTNMKVHTIHLQLEEWRQKYGNIFQVPLPRTNLVVLNSYQAIHEALVTKGDIFSARSEMYALKAITENNRGPFCGWADQRSRSMRKTCILHVKQYGHGQKQFESTSTNQAHHLVKSLETHNGNEIDAYDIMYSASLNAICKLICGESLPENSPWEQKIIEYERLLLDTVFDPVSFILNIIPLYYVYETQLTKKIKRLLSTMNEIWHGMFKHNMTRFDEKSLVRDLLHKNYEEVDVRQTIFPMFIAGIASTSNSFYVLINILLHKVNKKGKLEKEIFHVIGSSRLPKLQDRQNMPYARAIIFELLRYHTVAPQGSIRETTEETSICGHPLPAATKIMFNLWGLHHDEKFWGDPWEFRPERFLSESGDELVPADHPNRRHLMAFSAGPRVCLGETMALDRLFIWLVTIVQRFDLQPGEVDVPYDVLTYEMTSVLRHPHYRARFVPRV